VKGGKVLIALGLMSFATLGDILMSLAMKSMGRISVHDLASAMHFVSSIFTTPLVFLALFFQIAFFFSWFWVLANLELSVATPLTAVTYFYIALLSGPMLHETVSPRRWLGTCIIALGVLLVTRSGGTRKSADSHHIDPVNAQRR
jgi:drug/metabolite transporter (DMT)-like permease